VTNKRARNFASVFLTLLPLSKGEGDILMVLDGVKADRQTDARLLLLSRFVSNVKSII
jgi:hypothetical protein